MNCGRTQLIGFVIGVAAISAGILFLQSGGLWSDSWNPVARGPADGNAVAAAGTAEVPAEPGPAPPPGPSPEERQRLQEILKAKREIPPEAEDVIRRLVGEQRPSDSDLRNLEDVLKAAGREQRRVDPKSVLEKLGAAGFAESLCQRVVEFASYYEAEPKRVSGEDSVFRRVVAEGSRALEPLLLMMDTPYGRAGHVALATGMVFEKLASMANAELLVRAFELHPELGLGRSIKRLRLEERVRGAVHRLIRSHPTVGLDPETVELVVALRDKALDPDLLWYLENGQSHGMVAQVLSDLVYAEPPLEGFVPVVMRVYERYLAEQDWEEVLGLADGALAAGDGRPFRDLVAIAMGRAEGGSEELQGFAEDILKRHVRTTAKGDEFLKWIDAAWQDLEFDSKLRKFAERKSRTGR